MSVPDIDDRSWNLLADAGRWVQANGARLLSTSNISTERFVTPFAIRGVLLESVHSNLSGRIRLIERTVQPGCFKLAIVGVNKPDTATLKLKLEGQTTVSADPEVIFETLPLDLAEDFTADNLKAALIQSSQSGPFPLSESQLTVQLGNPVEDDKYVGQWFITFSPELAEFYQAGLTFSIQEPEITGLTYIVMNATKDVVTAEEEIVTDIFNRPPDNPWPIGAVAACVPMLDVGYAIISSDYRDISNENT